MLFLLVSTAFAANCADKLFVLPAAGYAYGVKTAGTGAAPAKCATGTFTAAKKNSANVMQTAADIQAALKGKANGQVFTATQVVCTTGYTGPAKAKCAADAAPTAEGCKKNADPKPNVDCLVKAASGLYPKVDAGMKPGATAEVTCKADGKTTKAKGTAFCRKSPTAAAPLLSGCVAAEYKYASCPIPKKGSAKSEIEAKCNGPACSGTKPGKKVTCAAAEADAKDPECDVADIWGTLNAKKDAASCLKTAKKALGATVAGCTCTQKCKSGKTSTNTASTNYSCIKVADTEAKWKCAAPKKAGAAGSSASGVSMIAAAVFGVLSYAL